MEKNLFCLCKHCINHPPHFSFCIHTQNGCFNYGSSLSFVLAADRSNCVPFCCLPGIVAVAGKWPTANMEPPLPVRCLLAEGAVRISDILMLTCRMLRMKLMLTFPRHNGHFCEHRWVFTAFNDNLYLTDLREKITICHSACSMSNRIIISHQLTLLCLCDFLIAKPKCTRILLMYLNTQIALMGMVYPSVI